MWHVEETSGSAASFHGRDLMAGEAPALWWFEVDHPALVLGSSQPIAHVDAAACARRGVDVVRRRSGGGAVLLRPGDHLWVDVVIARDHPRWTDDVGASAWWLGDVWCAALATLGVDGVVHRGPMVRRAWSAQVCFAGIGGGEVLVDGRKLVGISQRRTRHGARFQCALYFRWDAPAHVELLAEPKPAVSDLADLVATVDAEPATIRAALAEALGAPTIPH